eukprot:3468774-Prymnesium_polylepis.2
MPYHLEHARGGRRRLQPHRLDLRIYGFSVLTIETERRRSTRSLQLGGTVQHYRSEEGPTLEPASRPTQAGAGRVEEQLRGRHRATSY